MSNVTYYVLGILYNKNTDEVVLLRKKNPRWQAGLLNGVGGHVEEGEGFMEAMIREGEEETGYIFDWEYITSFIGDDWNIACFTAEIEQKWYPPKTNDVGEVFEVHSVNDIISKRVNMVPQLDTLVAFIKDNS